MNTSRKPRAFISRTGAGLADLAEKIAVILDARGFEIILQTRFDLEWQKIRHMLIKKTRQADVVLCLVGPVYGFAPKTSIPEFRDPATGREEFSYTQLEYLIARRLHTPVVTILVPDEVCTFHKPEDRGTPERRALQSDFIRDFIKKDEHVYHTFSSEADLLDAIRSDRLRIPKDLLPDRTPENIPFPALGTCPLGAIFTGRTATLIELRQSLLANPDRVAVQLIHGTGGIGKTRVSVEYAHAHQPDYTARLFVRGGSPGALDESLASLGGLFLLNLEEQDEKETDVRIAAVLRWLALHPGYLLVIDNVDTKEAREHAAHIIGKLPTGHVLITSRLHHWPADIRRTPLDVLSDKDSRDLLLKYRNCPKRPPSDTDPADALALARDLDGLALAIEQAAAYLNVIATSIADYHALWKTNAARIHEWHDPAQMDYPASVATTWLTSFEMLYPASRNLLNLLSWLAPDPIPHFLLRPLTDKKIQPDPLEGTPPVKALGDLIDYSLAKYDNTGTAFTVHRLIQQITRERQPSTTGMAPAKAGCLGIFLPKISIPVPPPALTITVHLLNGFVPDDIDDPRVWTCLDSIAEHGYTAGDFACNYAIPNPAPRLLVQVGYWFFRRADYSRAENAYSRAADLSRLTTPIVYGAAIQGLGVLLHTTNQPAKAEAMLRRSVAYQRSKFGKNSQGLATSMSSLAVLLKSMGRLEEAKPLYYESLIIMRSAANRDYPREAVLLNNIAQLLEASKAYDEAEIHTREALFILESTRGEDHPDVACCLSNLACLLMEMRNRSEEAERLLRKALCIDVAAYGESHPLVAVRLNNLGLLMIDQGKFAESEKMLLKAMEIDLGIHGQDHPLVGIRLGSLGQLYYKTDRLDEAEKSYQESMLIFLRWSRANGREHPNLEKATGQFLGFLTSRGLSEEEAFAKILRLIPER